MESTSKIIIFCTIGLPQNRRRTDGRTYDEEGDDDDDEKGDDDDESFEKTTTTRFVTLLRAAALRFCDVDVSLRGSGDDVLFGDV
jgi:hypothetical protein